MAGNTLYYGDNLEILRRYIPFPKENILERGRANQGLRELEILIGDYKQNA